MWLSPGRSLAPSLSSRLSLFGGVTSGPQKRPSPNSSQWLCFRCMSFMPGFYDSFFQILFISLSMSLQSVSLVTRALTIEDCTPFAVSTTGLPCSYFSPSGLRSRPFRFCLYCQSQHPPSPEYGGNHDRRQLRGAARSCSAFILSLWSAINANPAKQRANIRTAHEHFREHDPFNIIGDFSVPESWEFSSLHI